MRSDLLEPIKDQAKLRRLLPLAEDILRLHEAGRSYTEELKKLSLTAGRIVGRPDVLAAFGSGDGEAFARRLAIDWNDPPADLTEQEMLELLEAICDARGHQVLIDYWVRCLEVNTGDAMISDLIFWPSEYFGSNYDERELEPAEMLAVALHKRRTP